MKYKDLHCKYCQSKNFISLNTYKHYAVVCSDCGNVSHFKKEKYLLEYLFPRFLAKKILPQKAFLRLYSDRNDFEASEFYDTGSFDLMDKTDWRKSELEQVLDQLNQMIQYHKILKLQNHFCQNIVLKKLFVAIFFLPRI